jgi:hypothetical protein
MSDNSSNSKNVRDDEIDILELFRRLGKTLTRWAKGLMRGFLISIVFLIRHAVPLVLSILAGFLVSYFVKSTSPSSYSSDFVLRNNLVTIDKKSTRNNSGTTSEIITKINKLHSLCAEGNKQALSKAISLNPDQVKNISDISAFWIIDLGKDGIPDYIDYTKNHDIYDTLNIRIQNQIDIRIKTNSNMDLDKVRSGIINFIESDSLIQQRNRLRLKQNHDMLERLSYDIQQLDSLQKLKYFEETRNIRPGKDGQIVFMQDQKTQLVYADIYLLYSKKQLLETEQVLYKGVVTVINDLSAPTLINAGTGYYGKLIIPVFFIATLIGLILIVNRKKLFEIYKKY